MAKIHPGATLVPHFRDFLPPWIARQPWYRGDSIPTPTPIGYIRFEDPEGEVGMETHLIRAGGVLYQVPMTYRGTPIDGVPLISTAEHSALGTRWIYDAEFDPVWRAELLRLVGTNGVSDPGAKRAGAPAQARGQLLVARELSADTTAIELRRVLTAGDAEEPGALGVVTGSWHPGGPETPAVTGYMAVLREASPVR